MTLDDTWLKLGANARGWVAFAANDAAESSSSNTKVRFKALSCEGERAVELGGIGAFCDDLKRMHQTLEGKALLETLEGDFSLSLQIAAGYVVADVVVRERYGGPVELDLKFSLQLDQSYIPDFARGMRILAGRLPS